MTRNIGKGIKGLLQRLHEQNENGKMIRMHLICQSIKKMLIDFNTNYFSKVLESEMYKDKIFQKLDEEETRNKIIAGQL